MTLIIFKYIPLVYAVSGSNNLKRPVGSVKVCSLFAQKSNYCNNIYASCEFHFYFIACAALQYRDDGNVVRDRLFDIRRKCSTMWNCPRAYRQEPKHIGLAPEVFANKLLRPYPESK